MPYLLVPGLPPQLISDAQANTLPPSMGKYLSQTPTLGADGTGQVLVNPDIPLQQWELNYLLDTGKLANEQQQTAVNAAQVGVNSQQLGINAFNAQAQLLGNVLQAYPAFRGPNNFAQYANFVTGTPGAGIPQFLAAAANQGGGLNYGYLPRGGTEPLQMGDVKALMQPPKQQSAGKTLTDSINAGGNASTNAQAGQQAASPTAGVSHGAGTTPGPLDASGGVAPLSVRAPVGGGPGQVYNAALGRWVSQIPGATALPAGAPGTAASNGTASVNPAASTGFDPRTSPLSAFPATYGRTPVNTPAQMGSTAGISASGGDKSDIKWKRDYHAAIEQAGFGHGSDARARANAAAGMSEAQAAHEIKHGRNPYTGIHAAEGMASVVTGPTTQHLGHTTLHTGEGGADELHIVIPLERRDQPIPGWALQLADALSPDRDHMRGVGGVYGTRTTGTYRSEMVGSNTAGDNQDPLYGVPPNQVDQFGQAGVGPNGVYQPSSRPDDTTNDQSNPIPNYRPGTYEQYQGAPFAPTYSPANNPNTGIHMAEGGAVEVQRVPSMGGNNATRYGPASQPAYGPADYNPSVGGLAGGESAIPATGGVPGGYVPYADPNGTVQQPSETPYVPDMRPPERAVAPRNLPHARAASVGVSGYTPASGGGGGYTPDAPSTPSIDPVLLGKAARWWAAQHGGSAADGLAALQLPENAAYLGSALGMAAAGEIDQILGPERPTTAPVPTAPANVAATRDDAWRRAYMAQQAQGAQANYDAAHPAVKDTRDPAWRQQYLNQQAQGARSLATGDYAGAVMGGVNGGLALAPGRVTTANTPVHLARGGMLMTPSTTPFGGSGSDAMSGGVPASDGFGTATGSATAPPGMMTSDASMPTADSVGPFDPTDPHPSPEALIEIRAELMAPPAANPTPLEQAIRDNWTLDNHGHPTFIGATTPDQAMQSGVPGWAQPRQVGGPLHMAQGGVAVIDAGGTIRQGNKPFSGSGDSAVYTNSSGQIQAPSSKAGQFTTLPAWKGSPLAQPLTANASVMDRILNTPSLKAAMESTWGARGLIPEDMWAQYLNGLKLLGTAPAAGRIGAGF